MGDSIRKLVFSLLFIVVGFLIFFRGMLVSDDMPKTVLEHQGFTVLGIADRHWFAPNLVAGCASEDAVGFDVDVLNKVTGTARITVCCGLFIKSCTVRSR